MPTYEWVALAVLLATLGGWFGWQFLVRRAQARFFDPAIEDAERTLQAFARQTKGKLTPSVKRWRQLSPRAHNNLKGRDKNGRRQKRYSGDGSVTLVRAGFPVTVSWLVVGMENGFALLPRVRVELPVGASLQGMHGAASRGVLRNVLDRPYELWAKGILDIDDRLPSFPLTATEAQAFDPLSARSCRVFLEASVPGHPITGALPKQYSLVIEVWGAPLRGESSPGALEPFGIFGWREDFDPRMLTALVDSTIALARTATPDPAAN